MDNRSSRTIKRSIIAIAGAAQRAVQLTNDQYTSGLIDFQNVLNG